MTGVSVLSLLITLTGKVAPSSGLLILPLSTSLPTRLTVKLSDSGVQPVFSTMKVLDGGFGFTSRAAATEPKSKDDAPPLSVSFACVTVWHLTTTVYVLVPVHRLASVAVTVK